MADVAFDDEEVVFEPTEFAIEQDGEMVLLNRRVTRQIKRIEQRETGERRVTLVAGDRYGVRIDQLHSLMIAAMHWRSLALEARLSALEKAIASA